MFAVIKTGGKQYVVKKGDVLKVEKLPKVSKENKVVFDKVLLISEKDQVTLGQPYITKAKVEAKLVRNLKDKKIDVFKYKNKIRYRKRYGHRQQLSEVKIASITM